MPGIAFYAPLKPPDHSVPSGDRKMARQLIRALESAGHTVDLASRFRSFLRSPDDVVGRDLLLAEAASERERIAAEWEEAGPPDLWLCYHPYYKSPDLIGPPLCHEFGVPWITVEASLSARRGIGLWDEWQAHVERMVARAAVNVALTGRDAEGLAEIVADAPIARIAPFLDTAPWRQYAPAPEPGHLITVAMMRAGDKTESYRHLAAALCGLRARDWHLTVIGDGPERDGVKTLFASLPETRVTFLGQLDEPAIARALSRASAFVWPGVGEAFGLAYLEAQAAGLPVAAMRVAGVTEVVADGVTGLLTDAGDVPAYSQAIDRLLADPSLARSMGAAGAARVLDQHSLDAAGKGLNAILQHWVWSRDG